MENPWEKMEHLGKNGKESWENQWKMGGSINREFPKIDGLLWFI